jgi:ATP-dependent Clp protease protease subunit
MPDLAGLKVAYFGYTGPIEPNGVTRIASAMNLAVNEQFDEVHLCFSSIGGYVGDGIYLYNHIRGLPLKVVMHNTGGVMSIALAVFLAASVRYCSAHSIFMTHPTSMPAHPEGMAAERLQASLNAALADDKRTEAILRERTKLPDDLLSSRLLRDVHIGPGDALKHGIVHEVREFALPQGNKVIQI